MSDKKDDPIPPTVHNEIEDIYKTVASIQRLRGHREYPRLFIEGQRLINLMMAVAGVYSAEAAMRECLQNDVGDFVSQSYPAGELEQISMSANEGHLSFAEEPHVIDRLESMLSCYKISVQKMIELMSARPR